MNATHTVLRLADRLNAPEADSVAEVLHETGRRARRAAPRLATARAPEKNPALTAMAHALRAAAAAILDANRADLAEARRKGQTPAFLDRLTLDEARIEAMAAGVGSTAWLPPPGRGG